MARRTKLPKVSGIENLHELATGDSFEIRGSGDGTRHSPEMGTEPEQCMTVSSFIVTPSEKRRKIRWRATAYNAKIRRILNNLPVFPKKNCTSKTKKFPVRFFAGTVFFWEHREII